MDNEFYRNNKSGHQDLEVSFQIVFFFFYKILEKEFTFSRAVGVQQFS